MTNVSSNDQSTRAFIRSLPADQQVLLIKKFQIMQEGVNAVLYKRVSHYVTETQGQDEVVLKGIKDAYDQAYQSTQTADSVRDVPGAVTKLGRAFIKNLVQRGMIGIKPGDPDALNKGADVFSKSAFDDFTKRFFENFGKKTDTANP